MPTVLTSPLAQDADPDDDTDAISDASQGLADLINRVVPSELEFIVENLVSPGLAILAILILAALLSRLAKRGIRLATERMKHPDATPGRRLQGRLRSSDGDTAIVDPRREQRADALGSVARSVVGVVIWSVAAIMILGQVGIELGPLIAGAGIVGVAIGFGAQDLVKDFLSGVFMLIEDQYGIGDIVDVGEAAGVVESISLRSTQIRDVEGTLWHVPNGEIRRVGNMSQDWARALLDIGVAYGSDLDAVGDLIRRVAVEMSEEEEYHELFLDEPDLWGVQSLGADSVDIRLVIKVVPGQQWAIMRELRRRIKNALDAADIEIPFPQRTVWLRTEQPMAVGDAETEPFRYGTPDEGTKQHAVEASKRGDTGTGDDYGELMPDEPDDAGSSDADD